MSLRFLCFDLDGTLVDSRAAIVGCFQASLRASGFTDIDDEAIAGHIGRPLGEMLEGLVEPADQGPIIAAYVRDFVDWDHRCTQAFPGILEALERLGETDLRMAVTSSKSLVGIERVVREQGIAHHFTDLWGGDLVSRGKPNPEMLQRAMTSAGMTPAETLLVGDTTYDIEMGVAAGVRSLGVSWGMHSPAMLRSAGASGILTSARQLGMLHDDERGSPADGSSS